jgi:uroporphyrin-III C-methyltransferase
MRPAWVLPAVLFLVAITALLMAWSAQKRVNALQKELVKRQQESQEQAVEARTLARQAQEEVRDAVAKVNAVEVRVGEAWVQRGQLEHLIESLSRSRDENLLADIDAALRVAMQQTGITGTSEPLVAALRQADERLARHNASRLEGVRRAIARDLDRAKAAGVVDVPSLSLKLDEAVRLVDELPLVSALEPRRQMPATRSASTPGTAPQTSSSSSGRDWRSLGSDAAERVWAEVKSLVRVTRIEHPEAMLIAPDQTFFLRENLKLRLLNARLALLSRQYDTAQADLQMALSMLERYFDHSTRRYALATELMKQVSAQSRQMALPRPDDTLAALAVASAGGR